MGEKTTKLQAVTINAGGMNQVMEKAMPSESSWWDIRNVDFRRSGESERSGGKFILDKLSEPIYGIAQFFSPFGYLVTNRQAGDVLNYNQSNLDYGLDYDIPDFVFTEAYDDIELMTAGDNVVALYYGTGNWEPGDLSAATGGGGLLFNNTIGVIWNIGWEYIAAIYTYDNFEGYAITSITSFTLFDGQNGFFTTGTETTVT